MGRAIVNKSSSNGNGPMTSLEVIAERLQENRRNQLEDILRVSGSHAIAKNEYGVTIFEEDNIATSLLFKPLNKPKIDTNEVIKAIDVNVKELKPVIPIPNKDTILKTIHDDQVKVNQELTKKIDGLNVKINGLNNQITTLQTQVQNEVNKRLSLQQVNDVLNNQIPALNKSIGDLAKQNQTSVQKAVEESVLRSALQAQNSGFKSQIETLTKQIDSLNSIIEGLQSQLGGIQQQQITQNNTTTSQNSSLINGVILATLSPDNRKDIKVSALYHGENKHIIKIIGDKMTITNNDTDDVEISLNIVNPVEQSDYLTASKTQFTLKPNSNEVVTFIVHQRSITFDTYTALPKTTTSVPTPKGQTYGGRVVLTTTRKNGNKATAEYPTSLELNYTVFS